MKGFLTNFWTNTISVGTSSTKVTEKQHYASLAQHADGIYGLRTTPMGVGLASSGNTLDALDPNLILSKNILPITGHTLKVGDTLRFTNGTQANEEASVISIVDANTVAVVGLSASPALGDLFNILKPVTPTTDLNGNVAVAFAATSVIDTLDVFLLDPSVTTIPRSSVNAIQVVASTSGVITEMQFVQDIGYPMNLYMDAARTMLICHLPLTPDEKVPCNIPAGSTLFLGAARDVDITDPSFLEVNFIG
jgi:hypothetical protein